MEKLIELIKKGGFRIKSYDNWKMYLEEMSEMLISQGNAIEGFKAVSYTHLWSFWIGLLWKFVGERRKKEHPMNK